MPVGDGPERQTDIATKTEIQMTDIIGLFYPIARSLGKQVEEVFMRTTLKTPDRSLTSEMSEQAATWMTSIMNQILR